MADGWVWLWCKMCERWSSSQCWTPEQLSRRPDDWLKAESGIRSGCLCMMKRVFDEVSCWHWCGLRDSSGNPWWAPKNSRGDVEKSEWMWLKMWLQQEFVFYIMLLTRPIVQGLLYMSCGGVDACCHRWGDPLARHVCNPLHFFFFFWRAWCLGDHWKWTQCVAGMAMRKTCLSSQQRKESKEQFWAQVPPLYSISVGEGSEG